MDMPGSVPMSWVAATAAAAMAWSSRLMAMPPEVKPIFGADEARVAKAGGVWQLRAILARSASVASTETDHAVLLGKGRLPEGHAHVRHAVGGQRAQSAP